MYPILHFHRKFFSSITLAPNAISVAKRVIGPLSAILNLLEEMILTVLKVLQTLLLNA